MECYKKELFFLNIIENLFNRNQLTPFFQGCLTWLFNYLLIQLSTVDKSTAESYERSRIKSSLATMT